MMVEERNMIRLVAVQHLQSAYGIKTKSCNKNKGARCKSTATNSSKVFGVPLESLPYYNMECGCVPRFLVDACMELQAHIDTEGLFRKSGSVVRLKALRAKVDLGDECLATALPCDVAGLVKQFFRELPEPVLPIELQEAFLKAQQLTTKEERTCATMLLSSLLPDRNQSVLRHFFDFLQNVSKRSAQNKMDSCNLSVILAPNLLHSGDGTEKMNANTEKRLKLQTAVVHCFIEHAHNFGVLPQFLEEKVSARIACESGVLSPVYNELQEMDQNSGMKRKHRHSFGVFSSATPVIATPISKRKLSLDSGYSFGLSNKKRRPVKKDLGTDVLPNSLFSGTSTPGSAYSASGALDASQSTLPSASKPRKQAATSARRKSRLHSSRHEVSRVESGRAGCFSPKVGKKEAPRKSLRLRFSLGRSHKDAGSESIGWRLATQERTSSFCFTKETVFSPSAQPSNVDSKSSKFRSKSEDNLLTPQSNPGVHRTSRNREAPEGEQPFSVGTFTDTPMSVRLESNCVSEPSIVMSKRLAASSLPKKLCCTSGAESLECESIFKPSSQTGVAPPKLHNSLPESGAELAALPQETVHAESSDSILLPPPKTPMVVTPTHQSSLVHEQNLTFDIATLSPLHIDSVVLESAGSCSPAVRAAQSSFSAAAVSHNNSVMLGSNDSVGRVHCSRLAEALDLQSPTHFRLGVSPGLQSTPYKPGLAEELGTDAIGTTGSAAHHQDLSFTEAVAKSPNRLAHPKPRVADHIQHFNKLTLQSPKGTRVLQIKSPLKFQRTPVRQAVRRINSLLGESRRPAGNLERTTSQGMKAIKAVSLESSLSPHPHPQPPKGEASLVLNSTRPLKKPPKKPSFLAGKVKTCALGDVTNKVQPKTKVDSSISDAGTQKMDVQQLVKEAQYYRGSPRNPLNQPRLLSATKPVDL
ncbi:rho GTPase-activating protein 11A [Dunckerocampus dactyliophorus]|uniref:rho GTPase-activating protein 11A n=1 Tax=Dunckerocampus dactyliophorus TaxID=161453 RepID=UPI0024054724|nr:rho GTPase-activating protein 11A [Dunckerocampus dactyliophorus]